ncbi:TetR/AcrR family transcriptional regulator [Herbiconiux sp. SYSU D00978]|uniref:TetR/AcrR family transcriptional regulator n=1 Tax=Herbiconiux sp. SYSU D00978 TaxID=2812562 RepID=UPI001A96D404|nr:TetR/AcrR family transcriptional regulator [Herbiconiux sp. SYSU D00978]
MTTTSTRQYNSPLRKAEAAATRARILDAAAELFADQGYALTTMKEIADRARVSLQTVHLAGPKASILLAAYQRVIESAALPEQLRIETAADKVRAAVEVSVEFDSRAAKLWRAVEAATHSDPLVKESFTTMMNGNNEPLRDALVELGVEDPDAVLAELVFEMSPAAYLHFVELHGWTKEQYREWLHRRVETAAGL